MWSESDHKDKNEMAMNRTSGDSAVIPLDERVLEAAAENMPTMVNVSKSTRVHIGPKIEIKNIAHTEAVKDMPFHHYLWHLIKNSTRAERIACLVSVAALVLCIILVVYFTVIAKNDTPEEDVAPHKWYITRDMWLATNYNDTENISGEFLPLHLIIIAHSVSPECHVFANCASELRILQSYFIKTYDYDIPYNFLIGNDGRVYEGRGWGMVGAHTQGYNRCSLGVAFIGDYREGSPAYSKITPLQVKRLNSLLHSGISYGYLHPNYDVVGARDLKNTLSPGDNVYKVIKKLKHYSHGDVYKNKTCQQVEAYYTEISKPKTYLIGDYRE